MNYYIKTNRMINRIAGAVILIVSFSIVSGVLGQATSDDLASVITPLVTTKKDIQNLLGEPIFDNGTHQNFELKNKRFMVTYGSAKPATGAECKWNVGPDIVISVVIGFKDRTTLSSLGFLLREFERYEGKLVPGYIYYSDLSKGIFITSQVENERELVLSVNLMPTSKERDSFCLAIAEDKTTKHAVNLDRDSSLQMPKYSVCELQNPESSDFGKEINVTGKMAFSEDFFVLDDTCDAGMLISMSVDTRKEFLRSLKDQEVDFSTEAHSSFQISVSGTLEKVNTDGSDRCTMTPDRVGPKLKNCIFTERVPKVRLLSRPIRH